MRGLGGLPRRVLGTWPTPLRPMPRASDDLGVEVWCKREDLAGAWGGSKVRKLEYLIPTLPPDRLVVAFGAPGSAWVAAATLHVAAAGHLCAGVVVGRRDAGAAWLQDAGVEIVSTGPTAMPAALARLRRRGRLHVLPPGGSSFAGDLGSAGTGLEIARAIADGTAPSFERVFVACGTGGTAAGLAAGLGAGGATAPVVAVRTVPRPAGTATLARARARRVALSLAASPAPIWGDGAYAEPGYGRPSAAGRAAAEVAGLDDLELDDAYGAKAFAALVAAAGRGHPGPFLFVQTAPGPPPVSGRS